MAEAQSPPPLIDLPENPMPSGAACEWLSLEKGKILVRFAIWPATAEEPKGTVIVAPGRAEFIEKYFEVVADLRERGFAVAVFDWRGQGGSSRLLADPTKSHIGVFDHYVDDLEAVVAAAAVKELPRPFYLIAHATGATVALLAASHLADQIERMVLTAPLLDLADKRVANRWTRGAAGFAAGVGLANRKIQPDAVRPPQDIPYAENWVTSDQRRYERALAVLAAEPRLAVGGPTVRWFSALNRALAKLGEPETGEAIKIPTMMVVCGADKVVSNPAIETFARKLRSGGRVLIPGARHEILMERTGFRTLFWAAFDTFVPGSDLRLPTDIPPPRVIPELVSGEPARPDSGDGTDSTGTSASADEPANVQAEAVTHADRSQQGETAETIAPAGDPAPDAPDPSAPETAPAPTVARAPEKRTRRPFFSRLFGRKAKTAEPAADDPLSGAQAHTDQPIQPSSETSAPASNEAGKPKSNDQSSVEAALSAATNLVREASQPDPSQDRSEGRDNAPPPDETGSEAAASAPEPQGAKPPKSIGRLFRRRNQADDEAAAAPDAPGSDPVSAPVSTAAPEPPATDTVSKPETPGSESNAVDGADTAAEKSEDKTEMAGEPTEAATAPVEPAPSDAATGTSAEEVPSDPPAREPTANDAEPQTAEDTLGPEPASEDAEEAEVSSSEEIQGKEHPLGAADETDTAASETTGKENAGSSEATGTSRPDLRSVGGARKTAPRPVKRGRNRRR